MIRKVAVLVMALHLAACQTINESSNKMNSSFEQLLEADKLLANKLNPYKRSLADGSSQYELLPDISPEALRSKYESRLDLYNQLKLITVDNLSEADQINYAVLLYKLKNQIDGYLNKDHYIPLMAESGFHSSIARGVQYGRFKNEQDYRDYIARLNALPRYFEQQMAWMKKGLNEGITQPQVVLKDFENSISAYINEDVEKTEFFTPFSGLPNSFSDELKQDILISGKKAIRENVLPSYQAFYDFMVDDYIPNAKTSIAAGDLPNGEAFYQNRVTHYTTTNLTASEIHQIGLQEVARIRAEMDAIIEGLNFEGSFADFVAFLRTEPKFYAQTAEELLKEASYIAKKADAKLPQYFKLLPRNPYGVAPVPAAIAPKYTTGRYAGSSSDDKAGYYWVNTYALDRRPLYVLEALTLHEAVPGHHLQIALAKEMENVPDVRRNTYISAFGEGWALYAEWLGVEMGFYQDPYSQFGRLTYEMWRAARLVVDTGIHAKGWSRQKAIDFLANNTALSMHNVVTEIDRYISWPGQALSYKMGELTIKRLRKVAEAELGEDFDIREFHYQVLKNGSVPLSLLETKIQAYIESEKAKRS